MGTVTSEIRCRWTDTSPDPTWASEWDGDAGSASRVEGRPKTKTDTAIVDEIYASTGAVLIGKGMFDVGFEPWGDPPPFGMPVFIVTHEQREPLPMQGGTT